MRRFFVILFIMFVTAGVNAIDIKLKNVYKTNKEQIRLCDLVDKIEGEEAVYQQIKNVVIETLPYDRRLVNIKSNDVLKKVKQAFPRVEVTISNTVTAVRWEETFLNRDIILREAKSFLVRHYSLSSSAEVNLASIPKIPVPSQDVRLTFEENKYSQSGNMVRLDGKVYSQNKVIYVFNVQARVQERREIFQAKRSINKGDRVTTDDFITVVQAVNPNGVYLLSFNNEQEYIANNFIGKGAILKKTDINTSPYVTKNEMVTVLMQSDTMQLSYQAIAKANGWFGDRIMLQNPESRQDFAGEVIDQNTVLVKF